MKATVETKISIKQNALSNCAALDAVLFTALTENLRLCSSRLYIAVQHIESRKIDSCFLKHICIHEELNKQRR